MLITTFCLVLVLVFFNMFETWMDKALDAEISMREVLRDENCDMNLHTSLKREKEFCERAAKRSLIAVGFFASVALWSVINWEVII